MDKIVLSLIVNILAGAITCASTINDKDVIDSLSIQEITVHAFNFEKHLFNTPAAIYLISKEKLAQAANAPIHQLLNEAPGVYMQSGSINTNRLTIRGIGSRTPYSTNKIRAYIDGIPLTNGIGETVLEDLNLDLFSKIEIIKGPASGFYGSGIGGTLLFETQNKSLNQAEVSTTISSFNTLNHQATINLGNDQFQHRLLFQNFSSDAYRENNESNRSNLSYLGKLALKNHQLSLLINHTDLNAFIPSSIDSQSYASNPRKAADNWLSTKGFEDYQKLLGGLVINSKWEKNRTSSISIFGSQYRSYELRPFNILEEESYSLGTRFIYEKMLNKKNYSLKYIVGNESYLELYEWVTSENENRIKGNQLSDNYERRAYFNIFGSVTVDFTKRISLFAAVNLNSTSYNYSDHDLSNGDQSGKHSFKVLLSPSLRINYLLSEYHSFYGAMSHGFSPPSLEETLLPNGQRNHSINPETAWSFELGSRGRISKNSFYDISIYYMQVSNLLIARRLNEDQYVGINAGSSAHPGIEYSLRTILYEDAKLKSQIKHNASYSPSSFIDFIDKGIDYSGNKMTGTPQFRSNSVINIWFQNSLSFSLEHEHTSKMPLRDDNSIYSSSYSLLNLKSDYKIKVRRFEFELNIALYNLLNKKYSSMLLINANSFGGRQPRYYYPGFPLNYSIGIRIGYKL